MSRLVIDAETVWLFLFMLTLATATPVYTVHRLLFLRRIDTDTLRAYERKWLTQGPSEDGMV